MKGKWGNDIIRIDGFFKKFGYEGEKRDKIGIKINLRG